MCDGEMQADVAVNPTILENLFPFSDLTKSADVLIFPDLNSANISYKLLSQLSDCTTIGPILTPMKKNVNILCYCYNFRDDQHDNTYGYSRQLKDT